MLVSIIIASFTIVLLAVVTIAGRATDKLKVKLKEEQDKRKKLDFQLSKMINHFKYDSDQDTKFAEKLVRFINAFSWTGYRESQICKALSDYLDKRENYLLMITKVTEAVKDEKKEIEAQEQIKFIINCRNII